MIDAQQVQALELHARARARQKSKSVAAHGDPVVQRIAPELAVLGEVIRRHAGDSGRLARVASSWNCSRCAQVSAESGAT